jgi:glutamate-1-semialdehyde 2,1-aminomutase
LLTDELYADLEATGAALEAALHSPLRERGMSMNRLGSMFTVFFRAQVPTHFDEVAQCDMGAFGRFHREALNRGVYLPPSQFEAAFLPAGLTSEEMSHLTEGLLGALAAV